MSSSDAHASCEATDERVPAVPNAEEAPSSAAPVEADALEEPRAPVEEPEVAEEPAPAETEDDVSAASTAEPPDGSLCEQLSEQASEQVSEELLDFAAIVADAEVQNALAAPAPAPQLDMGRFLRPNVISRLHDALQAAQRDNASLQTRVLLLQDSLREERSARARLEAAAAISRAAAAAGQAAPELAAPAFALALPEPAPADASLLAHASADAREAGAALTALEGGTASARHALEGLASEPLLVGEAPSPLPQPLAAACEGLDALQAFSAALRHRLATASAVLAAAAAAAALREQRCAASDAAMPLLRASQARCEELEASQQALTSRLAAALADLRAANTAAASAHLRASVSAALAASLKTGADDEDECDGGQTVPAAKARRLEAVLGAAHRELTALQLQRSETLSESAAEAAAQRLELQALREENAALRRGVEGGEQRTE